MVTINRRSMLGASAAGLGAVLVGNGAALAADGSAGSPNPTEGAAIRATEAALPALATTERSIFLPGMMATAFNTSATNPVWASYESNPYGGSYCAGTGGGWIGFSLPLPTGATLTGVDVSVYGNPRSGSVNLERYKPDTTGFDQGLRTVSVPAGTGAVTVTLTPPATEVALPENAYTVYLGSSSSTNVLRGVRLRYTMPSSEFVALSPKRVYDSRQNMAPDANGILAAGANRTVSVANGRALSGTVDTPNLVPAGATAIAATVTVADTTGAGFVAVNPGGDTTVKASTINWSSAGQVLANTTVVTLPADRTVTLIGGGGGGAAANVILDVVGYYL